MHLDIKYGLRGFPGWCRAAEIALCHGLATKPWACWEEQVAREHGARGIPGEETLPRANTALGEWEKQVICEIDSLHLPMFINKLNKKLTNSILSCLPENSSLIFQAQKIISLACIGYGLPHSYKDQCNFTCLVSDCQLPETGILQQPNSKLVFHLLHAPCVWALGVGRSWYWLLMACENVS